MLSSFTMEHRLNEWLPWIIEFCNGESVDIRRQLERRIRDVGADERSLSRKIVSEI